MHLRDSSDTSSGIDSFKNQGYAHSCNQDQKNGWATTNGLAVLMWQRESYRIKNGTTTGGRVQEVAICWRRQGSELLNLNAHVCAVETGDL